MKAQLAIPYAQPQAKALEILRSCTVAEDDESCPVFNLTPESYNPLQRRTEVKKQSNADKD